MGESIRDAHWREKKLYSDKTNGTMNYSWQMALAQFAVQHLGDFFL